MQSGQNSVLGTGSINIRLHWSTTQSSLIIDVSAFLLTDTGQVPDDTGFIFYGQQRHYSGALTLDTQIAENQAQLTCHLDQVPAAIQRIIIAASLDLEAAAPQQPTFATLDHIQIALQGTNTELAFAPSTTGMKETALIMGELYRRQGQWKFRALGHGFHGGLTPLARHYGVDVETQQTADPLPEPAPVTPPPPAAAAPKTAQAEPIPPKSITLQKQQALSLAKPSTGFGKITVNLNWTRQAKGGWFARSNGIDLDLGCMLEMQNGFKTVVQALGNVFGSFDQRPYAHLLGDDRTGDSASGETLLINGAHWDQFKRVLIYAFIYEGVPDWATAQAVVTIQAPNIPEVIVNIDEPGMNKSMCAIALLENQDGEIRVTKLIEYFASHRPMDERFQFGFQWRPGKK
jgi:tellurite resistance protein TerA